MKSLFLASLILAHPTTFAFATSPPAIESTLRTFAPTDWALRPNNLYRTAAYIAGSAECVPFPGAESSRFACSFCVRGEVDTCPNAPTVIDEIAFRGAFSASGNIISSIDDGGTVSESEACPR